MRPPSQWLKDWEAAEAERKSKIMGGKMADAAKARDAAELEVRRLKKELEDMRQAMADGKGQEYELQRQHEAEIEAERQKRVEHLAKVGVRRIMQHGLAKGWTTWHDQYLFAEHQRRLLAASAGRLARPKLAAATAFWRHCWEEAESAKAKAKMMSEKEKRRVLEAELDKLRLESSRELSAMTKEKNELMRRLTALDGGQAEKEIEMKRELEAEREKRVTHLAQIGIRRLFQHALAKGWSAWLEGYLEHKHRLALMHEVRQR